MRIDGNLSEIRAEVLLNYLYPEMEGDWIAINKGSFYRNYNRDALETDEKEGKVVLARDGFLRLLPEGLLTKDSDLKGEDVAAKYKELEWRRELLNEAFAPFDTYVLRKKLAIERITSELLEEKLEYVLLHYFGFDLKAELSGLVREAAVMLPFVSRWRGDLGFVANLLGTLTGRLVETSRGRYSDTDTTRRWMPVVRYWLIMPGLTAEAYRTEMERLEPLAAFVREWLIPFDVRCEIGIREHLPEGRLPEGGLTLNYNLEVSGDYELNNGLTTTNYTN